MLPSSVSRFSPVRVSGDAGSLSAQRLLVFLMETWPLSDSPPPSPCPLSSHATSKLSDVLTPMCVLSISCFSPEKDEEGRRETTRERSRVVLRYNSVWCSICYWCKPGRELNLQSLISLTNGVSANRNRTKETLVAPGFTGNFKARTRRFFFEHIKSWNLDSESAVRV